MIRNHIASLLASTAMYAAPDGNEGARPKPGAHQTTEVDTGAEQGFSGSISMDIDGDTVNVNDSEGQRTDHLEVGNDAVNDAPETEDEPEVTDEQDKPDADEEEGDKADEDDTPLPEVPAEFKADDPEVVAQFDAALKTPDGKLNMDALSNQWWANQAAAEDGAGHLTEATYEYLDHLGIPPEMVKAAEAGQQALNTQANQTLYARAGGKANLDAALKWGGPKEKGGLGGYTDAQQKAFNEALKAGGDKAADAIDLLMTRHAKATNTRVSPAASAADAATGGAAGKGGAKADVFTNRQEWLDARAAAGRDTNKQAAVSAKFRRSPAAKDF